ncbi:4-hydroxythreonine-4-phosphate dehydrogenase PdxA [Nitratireductor sp. StC3]|uniref:4-hydroxythreonine-4-phosphate dehydrogenase PdxA n=1 Tax=Nitratireductor sp. StC3 TaxID=2126741 RepID=UPI000D0D5287|nr:4-hydroxythreonine-4-phosphate dehydrogenase PdxA [Nitratireductor sp. StC3]PSM16804.1 4-hydroxythreonine-4-phosphate dehydrogenase PdxA [Nitratireductor sp. StC3]
MRPLIGISMGDPAGIGPEIIVKAAENGELHNQVRLCVIGHPDRLRTAARLCGTKLPIEEVSADALPSKVGGNGLYCLQACNLSNGLAWGQVSSEAGHAAFECLEKAVRLAQCGKIDAICTAPLNKEALHSAGHMFPGHTEALAAMTNTPEVSMMLVTEGLLVIHVTTHIGLLDAIERIDAPLVKRTILRGIEALEQTGVKAPRVGVCGINPHAGENGLFGRNEETEKIVPAVEALRARGYRVDGPLPADTLFYLARKGSYDLVVAMYHDQGHGPVKVLGLEAGVNVTVGLPIIRTSVDHGTAFDIAGTGRADPRSLEAAVLRAASLASSQNEPR